MKELLNTYLIPALATAITGILGYLGTIIEKKYKQYVNTELKQKIVKNTVKYIEQTCKDVMISNEDKLQKCKDKALEWLNEKNIKISDTELDILIESAVSELKHKGDK